MSELKRMSKGSILRRMTFIQSVIPRSQSDTSYTSLASAMDKRPRRGSDWSETMTILLSRDDQEEEAIEEPQIVLRPLQVNVGDIDELEEGSLLHRRLSRTIPTSKSSSNCLVQPSADVTRSQSMKYTKKSVIDSKRRYRGSSIPSEVCSSAAKVQQRTVSNRSLPLPGDESEYTRLRNFSITSKGVVNRGDSFRTRSRGQLLTSRTVVAQNESTANPSAEAEGSPNSPTPAYKVLIIGGQDVGKTSLKNQFMTSEYICAYDNIRNEENYVTIVLNAEESQLEFEEDTLLELHMNDPSSTINEAQIDAYIVVYSVTNRRSYLQARRLLYQIAPKTDQKAIILVGNKTDLARLRTVTTEEGKSLAKDRGCKFIETSVAINHQVDELLVGILTQIRMKNKLFEKQQSKKHKRRDSQTRKSIHTGSKASGVLKKILQRACLKSKSCDNLHVL